MNGLISSSKLVTCLGAAALAASIASAQQSNQGSSEWRNYEPEYGEQYGQSRQSAGGDKQAVSRSFEGQIQDLRRFNFPGHDRTWILASVQTTDGHTPTIILGPEDRLQKLDLESGDYINVQGLLAASQGRGLFAAQRVACKGQSVAMGGQMEDGQAYTVASRSVEGAINEIRRFNLPGQSMPWLIASIDAQGEGPVTVVLGPENRLQLNLQTGGHIKVEGIFVAGEGRGLFAAQRITTNGQTVAMGSGYGTGSQKDQVSGYAHDQQGSGGKAITRNLEGKITELQRIEFPGQDKAWMAAAIETSEGEATTMVLGPEDKLQKLNLNSGDSITVTGLLAAAEGRGMFAARRITANDQTVTFSKQVDPQDGKKIVRNVEGEISEMKPITLPGQEQSWLVAAVKSPDGQSKTVVLGPEERLQQLDLQQGDYVSVQGVLAAEQGRGLFAAHRVRAKGQSITTARSYTADDDQAFGYVPDQKDDQKSGEQKGDQKDAQKDHQKQSFEGQKPDQQQSSSADARMTRHVEGEITELQRLNFPGSQAMIVVAGVKAHDGETIAVILGPEDKLQKLELKTGDRITVDGVVAAGAARILAARRITTDKGTMTQPPGGWQD